MLINFVENHPNKVNTLTLRRKSTDQRKLLKNKALQEATVSYLSPEGDKAQILKDNNKKSGIYC